MLTGDNEKKSKCYSKTIRDRKSCSKCITKSKGRRNKETKKNKGLVMMCGDGINDSVSLVTADIGINIKWNRYCNGFSRSCFNE